MFPKHNFKKEANYYGIKGNLRLNPPMYLSLAFKFNHIEINLQKKPIINFHLLPYCRNVALNILYQNVNTGSYVWLF